MLQSSKPAISYIMNCSEWIGNARLRAFSVASLSFRLVPFRISIIILGCESAKDEHSLSQIEVNPSHASFAFVHSSNDHLILDSSR
jgi:hypothetical protein